MAGSRQVKERHRQLRLLPDKAPLEGLTPRSKMELREALVELLLKGPPPKGRGADCDE